MSFNGMPDSARPGQDNKSQKGKNSTKSVKSFAGEKDHARPGQDNKSQGSWVKAQKGQKTGSR